MCEKALKVFKSLCFQTLHFVIFSSDATQISNLRVSQLTSISFPALAEYLYVVTAYLFVNNLL